MLRGSAQTLPAGTRGGYVRHSPAHGYEGGEKELDPAQVLRLEFGPRPRSSAVRRAPFRPRFPPRTGAGHGGGPGTSRQVPRRGAKILGKAASNPRRLREPEGARRRGRSARRLHQGRRAGRRRPQAPSRPHMALNTGDRSCASRIQENYRLSPRATRRIELLLSLFAGSQFLAGTLVRNATFFTGSRTRPTCTRRGEGRGAARLPCVHGERRRLRRVADQPGASAGEMLRMGRATSA